MTRILSILYVILIFFLISGCGASQSTLPYDLVVTGEGVGGIHPDESFEPGVIESKLPGFNIETMTQITPEKGEMILLLKRNGKTLAYITSDKDRKRIRQITVVSQLIRDKSKRGIGDKLTSEEALICKGENCHYADTPNLSYRCTPDHTIREITVQKL